jgi:hypothetical protein
MLLDEQSLFNSEERNGLINTINEQTVLEQVAVAGCCECRDGSSGSGATELVS